MDVFKKKSNDGFTFYRQKPLDRYIVDFYCPKVKLVIEVEETITLARNKWWMMQKGKRY